MSLPSHRLHSRGRNHDQDFGNLGQRPQLQLRPWLVTFRCENGFWIGAGNFADGDPPEPADQRANQK